ncbi:MAG: ABC transporter substrate-binding protein [Nitrospiraceae bacterium]
MNRSCRVAAILACSLLWCLLLVGARSSPALGQGSGAARTFVDLAGRTVELPAGITRVATLGPVPVLNSFVFALGRGDAIVNGLPYFAQTRRHQYQRRIAPALSSLPVVQGPGHEPNMEALIALRPDVVLTMDRALADALTNKGLRVLCLSWRNRDDMERTIALLGEALERRDEARRYLEFLAETLGVVQSAVGSLPSSDRPRVLFLSLRMMSVPHLIGEWWITEGGGVSVTSDGRLTESLPVSPEQVLAWNPDILIVSAPAEIEQVYQEPRFRHVKAVRQRRVHAIPAGAHPWGYRTAEQPLTVLWAATLFHPGRVGDVDLTGAMKRFYVEFFRYQLSQEEAEEMLKGIP